ncbi:uncharacterized protein LOC128657738 [Bombina bombina]|uniref:uncharacterized protein LOC128657738 n=1 Tax=Bombina bombina TaxID=8345 RepID=UPI00235A8534|nr:uncharacterized protein LOC128657738 [Bombina bombina]
MTYICADETHEHSSIISSSQNNQLHIKHDLKEMPFSSMHPLKSIESQAIRQNFNPLEPYHAGSTTYLSNAQNRLYRSLENLQNLPWAALSDSSVCTHYRNVESDIFAQYRSTRHLSEGSAGTISVQRMVDTNGSALESMTIHRDLPIPPFAKVQHWLFPSSDDKVLHGDAKRELKEKLRIHSSKVVEPNKPVRPQNFLTDCAEKGNSSCQQCNNSTNCSVAHIEHLAPPLSTNPVTRQCTSILHNRTSPEHIKQEAMRRLQLRRQNSFPNLMLHSGDKELKGMVKSKTAESFKEHKSYADRPWLGDPTRRQCSKGKLYIPTFEEFKKMRSKEKKDDLSNSNVSLESAEYTSKMLPHVEQDTNTSEVKNHRLSNKTSLLVQENNDMPHMDGHLADHIKQCLNDSVKSTQSPFIAQHSSLESRSHPHSLCNTSSAPICSSPVSRFPLQPVTMHSERAEHVVCAPHLSKFPYTTEQNLTAEAHSSCCPSLLLEATDLCVYGAKLQKMKDGLIGSALDLIKKSCSVETAAEAPAPVKVSCDLPKTDTTSQEESNQSTAVTMTTQSCKTLLREEIPKDSKQSDSICSPGCRISSSDMTHEAVDTGKAQRGCRLRPHFSDPMPTDAVKRKQLELKIAAAARHHAQRRRQDRDNAASTSSGGSTPRHAQRSRQRWSNISSLSTDSGIVGVNDDREDSEASGTRATKPGEVERVDSGIGDALSRKWRTRVAEAAASLEAWEAHRPCTDCGERDLDVDIESRGKRRETLCTKCVTRRTERKEAVLEFVNTEASYGEDLRIIKEEFYLPMQNAGLLTQEQLQVVFSNIQELIDLNEKFLEVLQEEIDQSFDQGDDDLMTVCIGEIFLEFVNMLPAFQTYCLQQSASVAMLNALEKEKELLRIFLDVSQNDNTVLRRMNLRSFLIAPLQRVTKYPLLLSRILKSTTEFNPDHSSLWEAKSRIESHLEHINMKTKQEGNPWTLRSFRRESKKNRELTNIDMREMAIKQVGWPREETRFIKEGPLQLAQPADGQWVKKGCKALKFQNVQVLLMVNVRRCSESSLEGSSAENQPVKDAVLVLIKDKSNGKFAMLREPLKLSHCVVSTDPDCDDTFELLEIRREGFVFKDGDISQTQHWFRQIKSYSSELGAWKKRRNALPNIMISTTQSRS